MTLEVNTSQGNYTITIEQGGLSRAGEIFRLNRKVLIVTDDGVPAQYSTTVASQCVEPHVVTIPQGEASKSLDSYRDLLTELVDNAFTRSDCVVAVGGGVVGDLAGFAASTYMRGIDFYNIPTTVLSQVDSSIGGKTAVDFMGYKNLVGAFYPPKGVLIDPDTLRTLPLRHISNGLAESVKMAMTHNETLLSMLEKVDIRDGVSVDIIYRSLLIKKAVVEADEREGGLRKVLNFGHTLGHAFESVGALQTYYHGECVALGMLPMCAPAVRGRLEAVLKRLNLPTQWSGDMAALLEACRHDKKADGDKITLVYVPDVGRFEFKTMCFMEYESLIKEVLGK
ncbi:MAG: 3-dehydroquinate synthase [Clostridia bacterium]|nr:3-dehydroquinate synthase [Clostridia bacterium]